MRLPMLSYEELLHENSELRAKLDESDETLRAIRNGEVDALIVSTSQGNVVYTLQSADQPYRVLIQEMHQGAVTILVDGTILYSNRCFAEIVSFPLEGMLSRSIYEHFMPEDHQRFTDFIQVAQSSERIDGEFTLRNQQDEPIPVHIGATALQFGQLSSVGLVVTDLRESRQAEKAIRFQAQLLNTVGQAVIATNLENEVIYWNRFAEILYGWSATEAIGRAITDLTPSNTSRQIAEEITTRLQSGEGWSGEFMVQRKDGTAFPALVTDNPIVDEHGVQIGIIGISMDITDRKRAEAKLAKVNRTLALVNSVNQSIVRIRLLPELFETVCRIVVEIGGFHMAWIGLLDSETRQVQPVAHAGVTGDYLELLDIVLEDAPRGHGPTATALRTGEPVIVNDVEHDPRMVPWREAALRLGYRSCVVLSLNNAGDIRGVLGVYSTQDYFFDDEDVDQLNEMAADISFAIKFAENETQRQQASLALQQQVQAVEAMRLFLQTTLDAFPANTVVLDPDGTIINVNIPWMRFADENSAPSPMHYLGANYLTVSETADGDDSEESAATAEGIRAVINGSQDEFTLEYPCHSPTEKRWFALRVTPFPEPAPRRVVVAHINISGRKRAEEDLQSLYRELETRITVRTAELKMSKERVEAILNNSADAILLVNGDFSIQQTNASFNNLFGCNQDDYIGKSINTLLGANDQVSSMAILRQAAADQSRVAIDVEARRKDNAIFAAELSIGFIRDDSCVCTFHDISDRKKIENSLHMAIKKEKELNELKTRFVSMASHEFRTPLATIHAATETLSAYRHKLTEDQIDKKLSNIRGQVGYLTDIMDDVLKLAQLQMRQVAFNPETVDFDALCRDVIDEAQSGTEVTHNILYTCAGGMPTAHVDRRLSRQLVSNLVSNAIKYSPQNKDIRVSLDYAAKTLVFKVHDSGIGVPEDDLKHLFEPFHRAANVGSIHGTGLGLVIAKESVELHGGTITIESQIGTGTTVIVHIPVYAQGV